jgi:hypothetical protein
MRLLTWVLVAPVLVLIVTYGVRRLRPSQAASALLGGPQEDYVRVESEAELAFYRSYAEFYEETPPELARFVEEIAATTGLDRLQESYPVDGKSLYTAASALAAAARTSFRLICRLTTPIRSNWTPLRIGA